MADGESGELLWEEDYSERDIWAEEETTMVLRFPKAIITRSAIAREIVFWSKRELSGLRLVQHILFGGTCIEEWTFSFGFVIAGSTNSWEQIIKSAPEMIDAEKLSGNITIETLFYDGDEFITKTTMRVFYD